ncbi:hypothetical protein BDFB_002656 [Asbolus verrucosus]|uniref:Uncharacterized protein n=1 Tax=Asbolus verrucosus TaxID=1661398 RepID=A0A482VRP3_ASBVE|nr:hypothetical protein BDFB_002656 [Asbolus verrucosus]
MCSRFGIYLLCSWRYCRRNTHVGVF